MTSKEIAGKFVDYFHIPFVEDDVKYIEEAIRTIVRMIKADCDVTAVHTSMEDVPVNSLYDSGNHTQVAIITLNVNVTRHRFSRKTGHIRNLTKLIFKIEHMAGFSSSIVAERMKAEGLYDLEHTNVESYEVWASTDAKHKPYRCRTWYPYNKNSHFFYDTQLCHAGIIEGITWFIADVLEDFGWAIPTWCRVNACFEAEGMASGYKLGGTKDGKKKKEIKQ